MSSIDMPLYLEESKLRGRLDHRILRSGGRHTSEVAATSGQVSIEMIEATQGKHHFEWHSPPRLVENPDNRLVIDDGDDGPWVKILQYADGPYKPTAKAWHTDMCICTKWFCKTF